MRCALVLLDHGIEYHGTRYSNAFAFRTRSSLCRRIEEPHDRPCGGLRYSVPPWHISRPLTVSSAGAAPEARSLLFGVQVSSGLVARLPYKSCASRGMRHGTTRPCDLSTSTAPQTRSFSGLPLPTRLTECTASRLCEFAVLLVHSSAVPRSPKGGFALSELVAAFSKQLEDGTEPRSVRPRPTCKARARQS